MGSLELVPFAHDFSSFFSPHPLEVAASQEGWGHARARLRSRGGSAEAGGSLGPGGRHPPLGRALTGGGRLSLLLSARCPHFYTVAPANRCLWEGALTPSPHVLCFLWRLHPVVDKGLVNSRHRWRAASSAADTVCSGRGACAPSTHGAALRGGCPPHPAAGGEVK